MSAEVSGNCRGCMDGDQEHVEIKGDDWCRDCLEISLQAQLEFIYTGRSELDLQQLSVLVGRLNAFDPILGRSWPGRNPAELLNNKRQWEEIVPTTSPHDPLVKFYKDQGADGNNAFATTTTADDPDVFLRAAANALSQVVETIQSDVGFTLEALLPQLCEIWAKLKGYKADRVFEQRLLVVGTPHPERSMMYLNEPVAMTNGHSEPVHV